MASIVIGDYTYTYTEGSNRASIYVTDTSKSSYGAIQSPVTIDGNDYYVTEMPYCFYDCTSLTQVPEIPNTVTNMLYCFHNCTSLTQAPEIPNSVTNMDSCFDGCTAFTQAPEIPNSVTNMSMCFAGCTALTQAPEIPNSVTNMYRCFYNCTSLTQAPEIPSSVFAIDYCFEGCTLVTGYIIVHNKPTRYSNAFTNTGNLKVITIGTNNTVYTTWNNIVNNFSNVTMASLSNVQDKQFCLGDYKYYYHDLVYSLGTLSVAAKDTTKSSYSNIISPVYVLNNSINVTDMFGCFGDCTSLTQVPEIPNTVTDMSGCFGGCTSLVQAPEIPNLTTNMTACFSGCTLLTQAPEIPNSVTNMESCFYGCTSLTQAPEIPSSVNNMRTCFSRCTSLAGYIIVHNKPSSYSSAFANAGNLKVITIGTDNTVYTTWSNIVNDFSNVTMGSDVSGKQFHLGDYQYTCRSTTYLDIEAIDNKSSYSEIITPVYVLDNSIKVVDMFNCFSDCSLLTQAPAIPNTVFTIEGCFQNCISLIQAPAIPNSVAYMRNCFNGCTSLVQAPEIPSSVIDMNYCFRNCTSLHGNIKISVENPSNLQANNCFSYTKLPIYLINNTSLRDSTLTTKLKSIASEYSNVFFEVDGITPPSIILKNLRVDNNQKTESSLDGTYVYTNAISTFYNTGQLPEGWSVSMNTNEIVFVVDTNTISSQDFRQVGPNQNEGNQYTTDIWYDTTDLSQHEIKFGIKLHVYDENSTYLYDNIYLSAPTILPSSIPLVSYKAGGDGIAFGQSSIQAGFYCNMDAYFKDKAGVMRALFDFFYPVGSYYETSVAPSLFNPNNAWGGTWVLETEGLVHISAGTNYVVNGAETDTQDGGSPYIQEHSHVWTNPTVPNHTHSIAAQYIPIKSQQNSSGTGGKDLYYSSGNQSKTLTLAAHNTNSSGACTTTGGGIGAVNNLPTGQTTGSEGNMPPYIVVYRWHRIADTI